MSRSENLCIPELLFGSIPFYTVVILGRFCLGMKVQGWYVAMHGTELKLLSNTHTLMVPKTVKPSL